MSHVAIGDACGDVHTEHTHTHMLLYNTALWMMVQAELRLTLAADIEACQLQTMNWASQGCCPEVCPRVDCDTLLRSKSGMSRHNCRAQ